MGHSKLHILLLLITALLMGAACYSQTDPNPLITEVQVTTADSTYRYL